MRKSQDCQRAGLIEEWFPSDFKPRRRRPVNEEVMKVYFTSDTHFGHANIIKYSNRPFADVMEMDETLIRLWNAAVGPKDVVYHLGDFSLGTPDHLRRIRSRLNGVIHLILGNHDSAAMKARDCFETVREVAAVKVDGRKLWLSHYAHRVWDKSHHGVYHLYGHSHGSLPDDPHSRSFDVGVDCHHYAPVSFERVEEIMSGKLWKPVDHHGLDEFGDEASCSIAS